MKNYKSRFLLFYMIPATLLLIILFFNYLSSWHALLKIHKSFSYNLYIHLYIHLCYFSMLVNEDIVHIEKPNGICSLTFVADEFSGLFLHP